MSAAAPDVADAVTAESERRKRVLEALIARQQAKERAKHEKTARRREEIASFPIWKRDAVRQQEREEKVGAAETSLDCRRGTCAAEPRSQLSLWTGAAQIPHPLVFARACVQLRAIAIEEGKKAMEGCTFSPTLNARSREMAASSRRTVRQRQRQPCMHVRTTGQWPRSVHSPPTCCRCCFRPHHRTCSIWRPRHCRSRTSAQRRVPAAPLPPATAAA